MSIKVKCVTNIDDLKNAPNYRGLHGKIKEKK